MSKPPRRRAGFYYKDDDPNQPYPSVTTILKVLNKPALIYWLQQQAAETALRYPELSVNEIIAKVTLESKEAAHRGTMIHSFIEQYHITGELPEVTLESAHIAPYIDGFRSFLGTHPCEHLHHELELYSDEYIYAGKCDTIDKIGDHVWLLDYKSNAKGSVYPEVGLQLAAYKQALSEQGITIDKTGVVCLDADGGFTFKETCATLEEFLHVKAVWDWAQRKTV